jgi:hypothetical protein
MKIVKQMFYVSVATATAVALSLSAQAQNLLVDPGFEAEGAANAWDQLNPIPIPAGVNGGWAQFGASLSFAYAHSGTYSAEIWDNSWSPQGVYQLVPAIPGDTYNLSAWYLCTATSGYATPALVQETFYDASGDNLGAYGPWLGEGTPGTWVQSPVVSEVAPANTAYIGAYLMYMDNNGANGGLYYDDAVLTQVPEPSTIALVACGLLGALVIRRRMA